MLHVDLPTNDDLRYLAAAEGLTVTIYVPTTPVTPQADADRIAFGNLARDGVQAARDAGLSTADAAALQEALDDLVDDDDFWAHQAHGLAVVATVDRVNTFRLPTPVGPSVHTGDRAHLAPLVAAAAAPRAFIALALSADGARLLESAGDGVALRVPVPDMPVSASDHAGKASINDRSHSGRLVGDEGRNVHLRSYARAVHAAVRPLLHGESEPLVLVATEPLAGMYRAVSTYPHLVADGVDLSADHLDDAAVIQRAAPVADAASNAETDRLLGLLVERQQAGRAALDASTVARAAVQGAVDTLLIDTRAGIGGRVGDDGSLLDGGTDSSVVEDLVRLVVATGGAVRDVPTDRLPNATPVAAILRWASS